MIVSGERRGGHQGEAHTDEHQNNQRQQTPAHTAGGPAAAAT